MTIGSPSFFISAAKAEVNEALPGWTATGSLLYGLAGGVSPMRVGALAGQTFYNVDYTIGSFSDVQTTSPAVGGRAGQRTLTAVVTGGAGTKTYQWSTSTPGITFSGATTNATCIVRNPYNNLPENNDEYAEKTATVTLTVTDSVNGVKTKTLSFLI